MNKVSLKFAPKSPDQLYTGKLKARLQSPSTAAPFLDEYENVESSQHKYETLQHFDLENEKSSQRKLLTGGYNSPTPTYPRIFSPSVRPQSYGGRDRMTPDNDKIKWEFNTRIDESNYFPFNLICCRHQQNEAFTRRFYH